MYKRMRELVSKEHQRGTIGKVEALLEQKDSHSQGQQEARLHKYNERWKASWGDLRQGVDLGNHPYKVCIQLLIKVMLAYRNLRLGKR